VIRITSKHGSSIPSCVAFARNTVLVGEPAWRQLATNPENSVYNIKRLIGRRATDKHITTNAKHYPFKVTTNDQNKVVVRVNFNDKGQEFTPEEVTSKILKAAKEAAESYLSERVTNAVITIPGYFDEAQRKSTVDAAHLAGLNVLALLSDSTATAIARYTLEVSRQEIERNVVIVQMGSGFFCVAVVTVDDFIFDVKAVSGKKNFGGAEFDNQLVSYFVEYIKKEYNKDITGDLKAMRRLTDACERAKITLDYSTQASIDLESLFDGIHLNKTISRSKFEELIMEHVKGLLKHISKALSYAKIEKTKVEDILLIGASTGTPILKQHVQDFFNGKPLNHLVNPLRANAYPVYGAAIQAAIINCQHAQKFTDSVILDVFPYSISVQLEGDLRALFPRNATIPCKFSMHVGTKFDNDATLVINVMQNLKFVGKVVIHSLAPRPRGSVVVVCFDINRNGILCVTVNGSTYRRRMLAVQFERSQ